MEPGVVSDITEDENLLRASQAAALIGISRPNLDKWLAHRAIEPVDIQPHPVGRRYDRAQLVAARDAWLAERNRDSDEKRRASALANVTEPTVEPVGE